MATRKHARAKSQAAIIFGSRLKSARELKGFKYAKEFAPLVGMKSGAYNKYERGESEPDFETLIRICSLLDVTPTFLIIGPVEEKANLASLHPSHKKTRRGTNS